MGSAAVARFAKANANFSERGEYLIPNMREEKDADGNTTLVYDSPANYTVKIRKCTWKTARDGGQYYIADYEVVKSNNPRVPVGALRNWMQDMMGDVGHTATTAFMFAALGLDRNNGTQLLQIKQLEKEAKLPEMLAETLEDPTDNACKNALSGLLVDVEVKEIITKGNKKPFNLHVFAPAKK